MSKECPDCGYAPCAKDAIEPPCNFYLGRKMELDRLSIIFKEIFIAKRDRNEIPSIGLIEVMEFINKEKTK